MSDRTSLGNSSTLDGITRIFRNDPYFKYVSGSDDCETLRDIDMVDDYVSIASIDGSQMDYYAPIILEDFNDEFMDVRLLCDKALIYSDNNNNLNDQNVSNDKNNSTSELTEQEKEKLYSTMKGAAREELGISLSTLAKTDLMKYLKDDPRLRDLVCKITNEVMPEWSAADRAAMKIILDSTVILHKYATTAFSAKLDPRTVEDCLIKLSVVSQMVDYIQSTFKTPTNLKEVRSFVALTGDVKRLFDEFETLTLRKYLCSSEDKDKIALERVSTATVNDQMQKLLRMVLSRGDLGADSRKGTPKRQETEVDVTNLTFAKVPQYLEKLIPLIESEISMLQAFGDPLTANLLNEHLRSVLKIVAFSFHHLKNEDKPRVNSYIKIIDEVAKKIERKKQIPEGLDTEHFMSMLHDLAAIVNGTIRQKKLDKQTQDGRKYDPQSKLERGRDKKRMLTETDQKHKYTTVHGKKVTPSNVRDHSYSFGERVSSPKLGSSPTSHFTPTRKTPSSPPRSRGSSHMSPSFVARPPKHAIDATSPRSSAGSCLKEDKEFRASSPDVTKSAPDMKEHGMIVKTEAVEKQPEPVIKKEASVVKSSPIDVRRPAPIAKKYLSSVKTSPQKMTQQALAETLHTDAVTAPSSKEERPPPAVRKHAAAVKKRAASAVTKHTDAATTPPPIVERPASAVKYTAVVRTPPKVGRPASAVKKHTAVVRTPPPKVGRPASAVKKHTAVVRTPPPKVGRPASTVKKHTAVVRTPPPKVGRPASTVKKHTAVVRTPPPKVGRPASTVKKHTAVVRTPPQKVRRPVSTVKKHTAVVRTPPPKVGRPASTVKKHAAAVKRPAPTVKKHTAVVRTPPPKVERPAPTVKKYTAVIRTPPPKVGRPASTVRKHAAAVKKRPAPAVKKHGTVMKKYTPASKRPAPTVRKYVVVVKKHAGSKKYEPATKTQKFAEEEDAPRARKYAPVAKKLAPSRKPASKRTMETSPPRHIFGRDMQRPDKDRRGAGMGLIAHAYKQESDRASDMRGMSAQSGKYKSTPASSDTRSAIQRRTAMEDERETKLQGWSSRLYPKGEIDPESHRRDEEFKSFVSSSINYLILKLVEARDRERYVRETALNTELTKVIEQMFNPPPLYRPTESHIQLCKDLVRFQNDLFKCNLIVYGSGLYFRIVSLIQQLIKFMKEDLNYNYRQALEAYKRKGRVIKHWMFVCNSKGNIQPFLNRCSDRRLRKIELCCHCRISYLSEEDARQNERYTPPGYGIVILEYGEQGNHFGSIMMLSSLFCGESKYPMMREFKSLVRLPSGQKVILANVKWLLLTVKRPVPELLPCPKFLKWLQTMRSLEAEKNIGRRVMSWPLRKNKCPLSSNTNADDAVRCKTSMGFFPRRSKSFEDLLQSIIPIPIEFNRPLCF